MAMVLFSKKDLYTRTWKSSTEFSSIFSSIFCSSCEIALCFFREITYLRERDRYRKRERQTRGFPSRCFLSLGVCLHLHLCTCLLFAYLSTFNKLKWSFSYSLFIVLTCYLFFAWEICLTNYPTGLQSSEGLPGARGTAKTWSVHTPDRLMLIIGTRLLFLATWAAQLPSLNEVPGVRNPWQKPQCHLWVSLRSHTMPFMHYLHMGTLVIVGGGLPGRVEIPGDKHHEGCLRSWLPQLFNISLVPHLLLPIFGQQCGIRMTILYLFVASHENISKEFKKDLASKLPGTQWQIIKLHWFRVY